MAVQKQLKLTWNTCRCICGSAPRGYSTDGVLFHLECYPCQHITPKFSKLATAESEFKRMVNAVKADRQALQAKLTIG